MFNKTVILINMSSVPEKSNSDKTKMSILKDNDYLLNNLDKSDMPYLPTPLLCLPVEIASETYSDSVKTYCDVVKKVDVINKKKPIVGNSLKVGIYGAVSSGKSCLVNLLVGSAITDRKTSITTSGHNRTTKAIIKLSETDDKKKINSKENEAIIEKIREYEETTTGDKLKELKKIERFAIYCDLSDNFGTELHKMNINVTWYDFIGGNDNIKSFAHLAVDGLRKKLPILDILIFIINGAESLDAGSTQTMIDKLASDVNSMNPDMLVLFVVNKIDLIEATKLSEVMRFTETTITDWIGKRIKYFKFVGLSAKYAQLIRHISIKNELPSNENDIKDLATYIFGKKPCTNEQLLTEIHDSDDYYNTITGYNELHKLFKNFVIDRIHIILGRAIVHRMKLANYNSIEDLDLILNCFKSMINYKIESTTKYLTSVIKDNIRKCENDLKHITKIEDIENAAKSICKLKKNLGDNRQVLELFSEIKELSDRMKDLYYHFLKKISVLANDYLQIWIDSVDSCLIVEEDIINEILYYHFKENKHLEIYNLFPNHLILSGNIINNYIKNNESNNMLKVIDSFLYHLIIADNKGFLVSQTFINNKPYSSGVFCEVVRECCRDYTEARRYTQFERYGSSYTITREEIIAYSEAAESELVLKYVDQTLPFLKGLFKVK